MKPQLIVALDVPSVDEISATVDAIGDPVSFYKVGLELFTAEGPRALEPLKERGKNIFLDLKLHDIPRTVARAVASASRLGVDLVTVHASGGKDMLSAAAEAAMTAENPPRLLAITVLTSLNDNDLSELGIAVPVAEQAARLGKMAINAGINGLVCSPFEASQFRESLGAEILLVTPGIRPASSELGDQKRVATPAMAVNAGANFLVVGRPILQAPEPAAAASAILKEMTAATL